jgi:hypothetical protein
MIFCLQLLKEYIQEIYQDNEGIMIICALIEQLKLLYSLTSFEIDMSFKRVKSSTLNEVVFATFLPRHGKGKWNQLIINYKVLIKYLLTN